MSTDIKINRVIPAAFAILVEALRKGKAVFCLLVSNYRLKAQYSKSYVSSSFNVIYMDPFV